MRILLISNMYAPEAFASAPLNADACRFLAARGHEVFVLTAFPHYPEWRLRPEDRGKLLEESWLDGVRVRRIWSYVPDRPGSLGRILHYAVFAAVALPGSLGVPRPDVIVCVSPPLELGITATLLGAVWRVPFVLWIKDLVIDAAIQLGMMKNRQAIALARVLERFVYRQAHSIGVLCEGFRDNLLAKGVPDSKIVLLPDWVDTAAIRPDIDGTSFRQENGIAPSDFVVLHSGNVGAKQSLRTLLYAAQELTDMSELRVMIVGDGAEKPSLIEEADRLKLRNLTFLPVQPAPKFPQMLAAADVLILHQKAAMVDSVIPSKLLTYMASGRPILGAVHPESETAKAIEQARCGIRVDPEQPVELAKAIVALYSDQQRRIQLGENGRRFVEANFARPVVLSRFEAVLRSVATAKG